MPQRTLLHLSALGLTLLVASASSAQRAGGDISLTHADITFSATASGTRYAFTSTDRIASPDRGKFKDRVAVAADSTAGILVGGSPVSLDPNAQCIASPCTVSATSAAGEHLTLTIALAPHQATLTVTPQHPGLEVRFLTGGASPAYGLGDHAVEQKLFSTLANKQFNTDVTGFADDAFLSGQGQTRLVSNFVIYPRQHFAELLIDPTRKIVHTSSTQIVQGVQRAGGPVTLHYFFGNPHEIYKAYLDARNASGYKVLMPKLEAFGVGWEAFGALGWETNQKTDTDSIDRYLHEGYPLKWVVVGSGFWPSQPDSMHETTSFGLWDQDKYPDPRSMIAHFHDEHLITMLGLRITFITTGPYAAEGVAKKYFLTDASGQAATYTGGWPKMPYHLIDAHNPAALDWYMALVGKWQAYGISGWKEDFYGYGNYDLRDDKVDPTNDRLMAQHQLIIERNGYLSSNGDLHRINDFNYNQDQDRGPVNALALAYSGFPLVYPDIVGGTFGENHFSTTRTAKLETYMQRNAQWASLHSSMGMGEPPWTFSRQTADIMLKAAKLHERIAPYLFSNARRFVADGYPWTMTPLPIAFPDDAQAYGHEHASDRGYEWMIGDAMLAVPLYGNDYDTAVTRDVYLPAGQWMDFDTGKLYAGNQTLKGFTLPPGKTPLFIGGSGITLEQVDGKTYVCVYPIAPVSSSVDVVLSLPDDPKTFSVHLGRSSATEPGRPLSIEDHLGQAMATTTVGRATGFLPKPGEMYTVE